MVVQRTARTRDHRDRRVPSVNHVRGHGGPPGVAATAAEAIHRATILTPEGVRKGLERIRFLPTATGGPRTHIAGAPGDHNLFKGDWLIYSKMVDGKLQFEGLFEPST